MTLLQLPEYMHMFTGSYQMRITDGVQGVSFPALVFYPTRVPSTPTTFGPYTIDVSPDAPVADGRFPLVVISHGGGGSHLVYRALASHLARHGYVVVMPEHPGNNRNDNALHDTDENLTNRPRHIRLTIDAVSSDARFNACVQPDKVVIIGHSLGGYTALALAGGAPWSQRRYQLEVEHDSRVCALVLLAPATGWYIPEGALSGVTVPILMLVAEHDPYTPRWNAEVVLKGVPDRSQVRYRVIENAGHFSFLTPFPPQMSSPTFLPSTDPEGFDRERFQKELAEEVVGFLEGVMRDNRGVYIRTTI